LTALSLTWIPAGFVGPRPASAIDQPITSSAASLVFSGIQELLRLYGAVAGGTSAVELQSKEWKQQPNGERYE